MTWDPRQTAMLAAMGLRVWPRDEALQDAAPEPAEAPTPQPEAVAVLDALPLALRVAALTPAPTPAQAPAPVASELQAMGWEALRAAAADFCTCGHCGSAARIFGQGMQPAQCLVLVDGEAAAVGGEHGQGPLSGEAAVLLANLLRAMGLDATGTAEGRPTVFVTSPLKCRVQPGAPAALAQTQPLLARQIELLAPRLILALGPISLRSLLASDEPLGRLRGRVHVYAHAGANIPVVVSYHPAYLLRQQADKPRAWADLCLALQTLEQPA